MTSHLPQVFRTQEDITKAVTIEFEKRQEELYKSAQQDIANQLNAVWLCVLEKELGFKKNRLTRIYQAVALMFKIMINKSLPCKFDNDDCIQHLRDKFGIDVEKDLGV